MQSELQSIRSQLHVFFQTTFPLHFQPGNLDFLLRFHVEPDGKSYNHGNKLSGQVRKTVLSMTPQAMYNQFKRTSVGSVRELYYIYLMSHMTIITRMAT